MNTPTPNAAPRHPLRHLTAPLRLALETRAGWEFGALVATAPLLAMAPRGDGHPVLVLPRLLGSDLSTQPLRACLTALGYSVSPWGLGRNLGPRPGVFDQCRAKLDALHRRHRRRVSLVGWSVGGLYARELAKQAPEAVRCVITLGAPIHGDPKPTEVWKAYEKFTGQRMGLPETQGPLAEPPPVPCTAIASRSDGVVPWPCANESKGSRSETIEVEASHLGLAMHPLAVHAVADRLAQPDGNWRPFARRGLKGQLYGDPDRPGWIW